MKTIHLKVLDAREMTCYVAEPVHKAKAAVIVVQEAFGVTAHVKELTQRFAREGYLAIAPEIFHRTAESGWTCAYTDFPAAQPHFMAITEDGMINDIQACYDWISKDQKVMAVGCSGYCLGGRVAFAANSKVPLKAAVSYYGGRIAPFLLPMAAKQIAPLLFFWGGKDAHIPADQIKSLTDALDAAKKPYTNIVISDADHGFFTDDKESYNPTAAKLSWATTLEFFKMHLLS